MCRSINSNQNQILPTKRGVPPVEGVPGSVLGPVLFILYTNDIVSVPYSRTTVSLLHGPNHLTQESLRAGSTNLISCQYGKAIQPGKWPSTQWRENPTDFFGLGKNNAYELSIHTNTEVKYRGITIDNNLDWQPQVDQLCKKISTALYIIKPLNQISTESSRTAFLLSLNQTFVMDWLSGATPHRETCLESCNFKKLQT